ncbi:MAG: ABC transporter ATP-binding protein [Anaerolineae bacterium]|nr:ABC transporter ATP-binding protein [Anaerolineae bacterium]
MVPSIEFNHVSKRYRIGRGLRSLREILFGWKNPPVETFHWAVKDVSFAGRPGEALGIIGPNGAGKTTILKLLSKVTRPTSGEIKVNGRFSALIELGAGFHPDLTGRENIYLNGTILGMRKAEIEARFDQIVDFAGIGQYLDTPVKRYSSGMYARLGFAIAAHVDPEVLLVDEVLAVGDSAFRAKCYARMDELRTKGTSLILVSHDLEAVRRVCDRGLVMYRGEAVFQGTSAEAVAAYSTAIRQAARAGRVALSAENGLSERVMTFDAEIENISLLNAAGWPVTTLSSGAIARVAVNIVFHREVYQPIFALTIRTPDGQVVYDTTTRWMKVETPRFSTGERCCVEYTLSLPLLEGAYELGADVAAANLSHYYDRLERALVFWVTDSGGARGLVDLGAKVRIKGPSLEKKLA